MTLRPAPPHDYVGRAHNRLNDDYHALHALCHFFLEHTGPSHAVGRHRVLPFLVDMSRLYERFIAEWLRAELPPQIDLRVQERLHLDAGRMRHFMIDLLLYDTAAGAARSVIDTKHKFSPTPSSADVVQVIAYAEAKGGREAVLVYPQSLATPSDERVGDIRVRTLTFPLEGHLDQAGEAFMRRLLRRR